MESRKYEMYFYIISCQFYTVNGLVENDLLNRCKALLLKALFDKILSIFFFLVVVVVVDC